MIPDGLNPCRLIGKNPIDSTVYFPKQAVPGADVTGACLLVQGMMLPQHASGQEGIVTENPRIALLNCQSTKAGDIHFSHRKESRFRGETDQAQHFRCQGEQVEALMKALTDKISVVPMGPPRVRM